MSRAVGICYRPPDQEGDGDSEMLKEIREAMKTEHAIIVGGFNCPHTDWVHVTWEEEDAEVKFLDTLNDYFLVQLVLEPQGERQFLILILSGAQDMVKRWLQQNYEVIAIIM